MRENVDRLRAKLEAGEPVIGSGLFTWSPAAVEIAGMAGLDFLRIDSEHSWRRDAELENLVRAAALTGAVPIVRIDGSEPHLAMKAFEAGAGGIIVTEVDTPEQAEAAVRSAKFPPRGFRGYSSKNQGGRWGTGGGKDWVEWSDRQLLVGIMVENPHTMEHIDEIFAIDGLDFGLFGPADYALALGLRGPKKDAPDIEAALACTIKAAKAHGKHVMYNNGTSATAIKAARDMGIDMIEVGDDIGLLKKAWSDAIAVLA